MSIAFGLALLLLDGLAAAQTPQSTADDGYKRVLVLYSTRRDAPYTMVVENILRETILSGLAGRVDYYTEYIDLSRFSGPAYQGALRDFLRSKYADRQPDVIVSDGEASIQFLAKYRAEVFPGVPLVFSTEERDFHPLSNATGVVYSLDMKSTLKIALQLHPGVKRVFVVHGASEFDRLYEQISRQQFHDYETRVEIDHLSPMPLEKLRQLATTLPSESILYFASFFEDDAGHKFIPQDVLSMLSREANAPIYCWPEMTLGLGIVGGDLLSEQDVAKQTASIALRLLRGEAADSIPKFEIRPYVRVFDWRQLQRWQIDERQLPTGSVVYFKDQSFWYQYRWQIVATLSLLTAQALLIAGLIVNRVRRGRAEQALRASHGRIEYLARHLIVGHEEERRRIARELHDDFSQQITTLVVDLSNLQRQCSGADPARLSGLSTLRDKAVTLAEGIHRLSHDLHSSTLAHVGLGPAVEAYCEDLSHRENLDIQVDIEDGLDAVSPDAALCLYRIAQEALRNAVKHSGSKRFEVEISANSDSVVLRVADHGRGFDHAQMETADGLGLISMEERARLLGGTLRIDTLPGAGTTVTATIPGGSEASMRVRPSDAAVRSVPTTESRHKPA
jgi:signal transduction histidine kinase